MPGREFLHDGALGDHLVQTLERKLDVALDGQMDLAVLVVLGLVDVHMDDGAGLAELLDLARDAIIETHAESEEEIRAVLHLHLRLVEAGAVLEFTAHGPVCVGRAVHAEPAQRERMRLGKRAHAHDGRGHGNARGFRKLAQLRRGFARDDTAAAVEHRALGLLDQADDFVERHVVGAFVGAVAAKAHGLRPDGLGFLLL